MENQIKERVAQIDNDIKKEEKIIKTLYERVEESIFEYEKVLHKRDIEMARKRVRDLNTKRATILGYA